jgi:hypothetical protein
MTIIPSRPGMEATLKRLADGRIAGISSEHEYVRPLQWQLRPNSSFAVIRCEKKEEVIVQLLVNEEHLMISADGNTSKKTEGSTNADFHLAAVVYINGVKQAQFKMKKQQMPTSVSSKVYTINVGNRGNGKGMLECSSKTKRVTNKSIFLIVGDFMVPPELGAPPADIQLQVYRYWNKCPKRIIKKEDDTNKRSGAASRYRIKKQGRSQPFALIYHDPKDQPYAVFRWMYHTRGEQKFFSLFISKIRVY